MVSETAKKRQLVGTVISARNPQTIIVGVQWTQKDLLYRKNIRRMSKFNAHDGGGEARLGDVVLIEECRPMSATKRWRLVKVITKGEVAQTAVDVAAAVAEEEIK